MLDNKNGEIGYRCHLDSVYFKGNKDKSIFLPIDAIASFSPRSSRIYVPLELMNSLVQNYFPSNFFSIERCYHIDDSEESTM